MDPSSYKYNAMAFWMDHYDADDGMSAQDFEDMVEELDATAQDVASFYIDFGEAPWLCSEVDLQQLERLRSACEMLLVYWKNGTAVDGGSEVADRVRAALQWDTTRGMEKCE